MDADKKFATGTIKEPHDNDLICGRGGKVNAHPGNRRFRAWVNERKEAYTRAHAKGEKNAIAQSILHALVSQNPPGRVLHFDDKTGIYKEVSMKKAMSKTTQALREGAPELRKKKGLPPPKELSKAKQASLSMSSAEDHHPSVSDRPKVVHIKASGFLENDAEHEYDASSSSSGSVDSVRVSVKGSYHEHATVVGAVGGSSRKHDHFSHPPPSDDFDQDHNYAGFGKKKKPRIVGAASSDEDSSTKRDSALASPPISDSASLLYALATTCAKQVPSMESPPVSGQEDAPSEQRLVTPTTGKGLSSRRLWTDQHQHSGAAAASIGTSYTSYTSLTSSTALTASDSLRLEKEKTVQSFLITSLPCIYLDDVRDYTKRLVDDGFDCKQMLTEQLEEDDLDFMKKAHKRALLQVIRKAK